MRQILGPIAALALMGTVTVAAVATPADSLTEETKRGVAVAILATTFFLAPACLVASAQPD